MSPSWNMNASFGATMPRTGNIAFFSQSGALGTAILDVAVGEDIGLSRFISFGNKADVDETDLIEALGEDERTDVILGYVESINDGQKFMQVARRVAKRKPVVIFKSGRTSAGARAASSHTGSLAGADSAYAAAFRQCGVIRAENVDEFFNYARAFAARRLPAGPAIAVVTNAGGPGIIATDAVEVSRLEMAELAESTREDAGREPAPAGQHPQPGRRARRRQGRPLQAGHRGGEQGRERLRHPDHPHAPDLHRAGGHRPGRHRRRRRTDKPILASFMGSASVRKSWDLLEHNGVPNFRQPDSAVKALEAMFRYAEWRRTDRGEPARYDFDTDTIRATIEGARSRGLKALGEREARDIATACGIPLPQSILATDAEAAAEAAEGIGYPVVVKISSDDILHKSDAGGVKVGVKDAAGVRAAFEEIMSSARAYKADAKLDGVLVQQMAPKGREVIIGVNRDPQFGPVIMFGLGGIYVEVLKDVTFRVAPLTQAEALEMTGDIRAARILHAFRGDPEGDLQALAECLTRVSQLAVDFPELSECDLNPVMVYPQGKGVIALDVRFGIA